MFRLTSSSTEWLYASARYVLAAATMLELVDELTWNGVLGLARVIGFDAGIWLYSSAHRASWRAAPLVELKSWNGPLDFEVVPYLL